MRRFLAVTIVLGAASTAMVVADHADAAPVVKGCAQTATQPALLGHYWVGASRNVRCRTARRVAKHAIRYHATAGWHCKPSLVNWAGGGCKRGARTVSWWGGGE